MLRLVALSLLAMSCAASQHEPTSARGSLIRGSVLVPSAGNLAVYWLLPGEVHRDPRDPSRWGLRSMRAARNVLSRTLAFADVRPNKRISFRLKAPSDAMVFALLDVHGRIFDTLLDGAAPGDWSAAAEDAGRTGRADLVLTKRGTAAPTKERCNGPRDHLEVIDAPEVAGTVGNDTHRRLCVHLPDGYDAESTRRYPVVYVLPGFSGQDSGGSIELVFRSADEASDERRAIFVGVNIATKHGASYLVDSPLSGNFDKFLTEIVPAFIDGAYRTRPSARALIGQSTGGFDVVSLALRHSDRFGVAAESSADGLDFGSWLLRADGRHLSSLAHELLRLEDAFGPPGQMASYAADWSPDPTARRGYLWPASPISGELIPDVWQRWLSHSPSELIKDPKILDGARHRLSGNLYLTAGLNDDFDLYAPAKRFSEALSAAGVSNQFVVDDEDHAGSIQRKRKMVTFVLERLSR